MSVLHAAFLRIESVDSFSKGRVGLEQYVSEVGGRFTITGVAGRDSDGRLPGGRGHGAHVETIVIAEVGESAVVEALLLFAVLIVRGGLKKRTYSRRDREREIERDREKR